MQFNRFQLHNWVYLPAYFAIMFVLVFGNVCFVSNTMATNDEHAAMATHATHADSSENHDCCDGILHNQNYEAIKTVAYNE